jgi:hypothetical protein
MFMFRNILFLSLITLITVIYILFILKYVLLIITVEFHIGLLIFLIIIIQLDNFVLLHDLNSNNAYHDTERYLKIIKNQAIQIAKLKK